MPFLVPCSCLLRGGAVRVFVRGVVDHFVPKAVSPLLRISQRAVKSSVEGFDNSSKLEEIENEESRRKFVEQKLAALKEVERRLQAANISYSINWEKKFGDEFMQVHKSIMESLRECDLDAASRSLDEIKLQQQRQLLFDCGCKQCLAELKELL